AEALARGESGEAVSPAGALFGESQSRVVLSVEPGDAEALRDLAARHEVPLFRLGAVGGGRFRLSAAGRRIDLDPREMRNVYESALPRRMKEEAGLTA
ncbi:MAG: hypothetical protein ACRELC_10925, partial [Gemmatimonadota bacterium]